MKIGLVYRPVLHKLDRPSGQTREHKTGNRRYIATDDNVVKSLMTSTRNRRCISVERPPSSGGQK